ASDRFLRRSRSAGRHGCRRGGLSLDCSVGRLVYPPLPTGRSAGPNHRAAGREGDELLLRQQGPEQALWPAVPPRPGRVRSCTTATGRITFPLRTRRPRASDRALRGVMDMANIQVLNGPNVNLIGTHQLFGNTTLEQVDRRLIDLAERHGYQLETFQSNAEHELIDQVQSSRRRGIVYVILNPEDSLTPASPCVMPSPQSRYRLSRYTFRISSRARRSAVGPSFPTYRSARSAAWAHTATS